MIPFLFFLLYIHVTQALECYVCTETIDDQGLQLSGDVGCFNGTSTNSETCQLGEAYCQSTLRAEFTETGRIEYTFHRKCGNQTDNTCTENLDLVVSSNNDYDVSKQCSSSCSEDKCNGDNDVELQFSKMDSNYENWPQEMYCHLYNSADDQNYIEEMPSLGQYLACPRYANHGCFMANYTDENSLKGFRRGCSPFVIDSKEAFCNDWGMLGQNCKQQCDKKACNNRYEIRSPIKCHVCNQQFNHRGQEIGGDENCFDIVDEEYLIECDVFQNACETDTLTSWTQEGEQLYELKRQCHSKNYQSPNEGEISCTQQDSGSFQYKDCYSICLSDGCNSNTDVESAHSRLDSEGNPVEIECYEHASNFDSFESLGQNSRKCPNFANWGCFSSNFTARNSDDWYSDFLVNYGCSMFEPAEREDSCVNLGSVGTSCKSQCQDSLCNDPLLQCQQCEVLFDHMGRVQMGNESCFHEPTSHLERCPKGTTHCVNVLDTMMTLSGSMVYNFTRACAPVESNFDTADSCTDYEPNESTIYQKRKSCETACNFNDCNSNNDVEALFSDTESDGTVQFKACYYYSSEVDQDYDPDMPGYGSPGQCPIFANQGCFASNVTYSDGSTEFHRGCSPFPVESFEPQCQNSWQNNEDTCHQLCKSSRCNRDPIRNPKQCHVCKVAFDHTGVEIGNYNGSECVSVEDNRFLESCDLTYNRCETITTTDWNVDGSQMYILTRQCGKADLADIGVDYSMCTYSQSNIVEYKDCFNYCYGQACNSNSDVDLKHTRLDENGEPVELECYEYSKDTEGEDFDFRSRKCPRYANWGCFTANFTRNSLSGDFFQDAVNKGCSMFEPSQRPTRCINFVSDALACKAQCVDDLCNTGEIKEPELQCQVCDSEFDHTGKIISGSESCFSSTRDNLQDCADGMDLCVNEMTARFTLDRGVVYNFSRYCSSTETTSVNESGSCQSSYDFGEDFGDVSSYDVSKSCITACEGYNCNSNNDVENLFAVLSSDGDGTSWPENQYCKEYSSLYDDNFKPGDSPDGDYANCPNYANAGCFAANFTVGNGPSDTNHLGFFRGCSPFQFGDTKLFCNTLILNGFEIATCKQQCTEQYCNAQDSLRDPVRCYNCREGFDHTGTKLNESYFQDNCYELVDDEHVVDCPLYFDHCETNLITDWYPMGEQSYTLERRCSVTTVDDEDKNTVCYLSAPTNTFFYKDCYRQCQGDKCNGANEVELEYTRTDENGDPVELECYDFGMQDIPENFSGNISDLTNTNDKIRKCPLFANWGCFTASFDTHGIDFGEGFFVDSLNKGCSIFDLGESHNKTCYNLYAEAESCKSQCEDSLCNTGIYEIPEEKPLLCHKCIEVFDHMGRRMEDDQNQNCYNLIDDRHLEPCDGYCSTSLRTDWLTGGYQQLFFERSCESNETKYAEPGCVQELGDWYIYKDCTSYCDTDGCNNNNDIELEFSAVDSNGVPVKKSCYAYREEGDGENYENVNDNVMECPRFANQGCFKADFVASEKNPAFNTSYSKGCSMYDLGNIEVCRQDDNRGKLCKAHCVESICNKDEEPEVPDDPEDDSGYTKTTVSFLFFLFTVVGFGL